MRTGIGYDIHVLIPTAELSQLTLGGVQINSHYQVDAHSDGDVLLHALVDAMLGALALGDMGQWFSDRDIKNKNRPSSEFIEEVKKKVDHLGWEVYQVDSIVFLENPKLFSHIVTIRQSIAKMLNLECSSISVKAKTYERLGPIGEGRAIAAEVIATLREKNARDHQ